MSDTPEIARIRAAMESGVTGWGNVNTCWITGEDDDGNEGLNIVGAVIEDEMYPVLEIDTAQYFAEAEGPKLAEYYAACNPTAMTAMLAHMDAQADEIERLRADAERYRWLRKTTNWVTSHGERIDVRNCPNVWDESIDACILAATKEQHSGSLPKMEDAP